MTLEILRAGPFTTVQDLGRPGQGSIGVPPGERRMRWRYGSPIGWSEITRGPLASR